MLRMSHWDKKCLTFTYLWSLWIIWRLALARIVVLFASWGSFSSRSCSSKELSENSDNTSCSSWFCSISDLFIILICGAASSGSSSKGSYSDSESLSRMNSTTLSMSASFSSSTASIFYSSALIIWSGISKFWTIGTAPASSRLPCPWSSSWASLFCHLHAPSASTYKKSRRMFKWSSSLMFSLRLRLGSANSVSLSGS